MTPSLSIGCLPIGSVPGLGAARGDGLRLGVWTGTHPKAGVDVHGKPLSKRGPNPLLHELGDLRPGAAPEFGQHGARYAAFAVPADEVTVAEGEPQTLKEPGRERWLYARAHARLLWQVHQQKEERTTGPFGPLSLDRQ